MISNEPVFRSLPKNLKSSFLLDKLVFFPKFFSMIQYLQPP